MFWAGLCLGLFLGANFTLLIIGLCQARSKKSLAPKGVSQKTYDEWLERRS